MVVSFALPSKWTWRKAVNYHGCYTGWLLLTTCKKCFCGWNVMCGEGWRPLRTHRGRIISAHVETFLRFISYWKFDVRETSFHWSYVCSDSMWSLNCFDTTRQRDRHVMLSPPSLCELRHWPFLARHEYTSVVQVLLVIRADVLHLPCFCILFLQSFPLPSHWSPVKNPFMVVHCIGGTSDRWLRKSVKYSSATHEEILDSTSGLEYAQTHFT